MNEHAEIYRQIDASTSNLMEAARVSDWALVRRLTATIRNTASYAEANGVRSAID